MSKTRLAILIFSLLVISCPLIAQNDDDEFSPPLPLTQSMITFTLPSENTGVGTFFYPEGWFAKSDDDPDHHPSIDFSNRPLEETTLSEDETQPELQQGQINGWLMIIPSEYVEYLFEDGETNRTPEQFLISETGGVPVEHSELSEIETFTTHDREAASIIITLTFEDVSTDYYLGAVSIGDHMGMVLAEMIPGSFPLYALTLREMLGKMKYNIEVYNTTLNSPNPSFIDEQGGMLSMNMPEEWASIITNNQLILANNESAIDSVLYAENMPQLGDILVSVSTFPRADADNLINLSANPDLQETLIDIFATNVDLTFSDAFPVLQFGTAQTVSLGNSEEVSVIEGTFILNGTQYELTVIIRSVRSEEIVFVAYGDDIRPFRDILLDLAASAQYER